MQKLSPSKLKLGLITGGQLGKMLIQAGSRWDILPYTMDADAACPAASLSAGFVKGSLQNYEDVYRFGKTVDVLTFEIENINVAALKALEAEGLNVHPSAAILELFQDKALQKHFYKQIGLPSAEYSLYASAAEVSAALEQGHISFPFVQKLCKGGYDGRGVAVLDSADNLALLLDGPCLIEKKVKITKELAVVAARNGDGEIRCFPAVEMQFNHEANLVEQIVCPADISDSLALEAQHLTEKLMAALEIQGLLAIEFFVDESGALLINEAAPRPHNSGHLTIEACTTSQYEQHLRAILNLPLSAPKLVLPAVMLNLLGEPGHEGPVLYEGLEKVLAVDGVHVHLYGKQETRPFRKMGHMTITAETLAEALEKADCVRNLLKVRT